MRLWSKILSNLRWLPAYLHWVVAQRGSVQQPVHLLFALADHFEPAIIPESGGKALSLEEQHRRSEKWCREYPRLVDRWRDHDGRSFAHTYFYPAEQYDRGLIERLAEHCHAGWGELEIQLHHGLTGPDTAENTRRVISEFRDNLVRHGCLSRWDGAGGPRYAFVHGNWALANSAGGRNCGVDNEMEILAETGCYGDFTLPSAPSRTQVNKINAIYECARPLDQCAPHRRGNDLTRGRSVRVFPIIVQGPLLVNFSTEKGRWLPRLENSELSTANPPTMARLNLWRQANITVQGRPDWIFIKLHCHGMDPRDEAAMLGEPMRKFLEELLEGARGGTTYRVHFLTAREMTNIALAACDGREGDPGEYRNYRLVPITPRRS